MQLKSMLNVKPINQLLYLFVLCISSGLLTAQQENLNVLDEWVEWSNAENMLDLYLNRQAFNYLDEREKEVAKINTKTGWLERQKEVKQILKKIVGPFPAKTPLNPQVTGTVYKKDYRIEKIIFESIPGYYVTGCLFIPNGISEKRPAILNLIGHTFESFRSPRLDYYQPIIFNLVKKGFIVFALDPVSQGERVQYTDEEKEMVGMRLGKSTAEHSYSNNQCLLSGSSAAKYFIWDGIRAIDYLVKRKEVDSERIGITGLSGGGTQTAYIAAFDKRIKAAAPANYITSMRRLLESIGPQDGEQVLPHSVANGIEQADLIEVFAPKPYLIVTTTRDFFSIQGARETYAEVQKAYAAFGKSENVEMVEDDFGHGYTKLNREAINKFFQEALGLHGDPKDEDIEILDAKEFQITPTGQVMTYLNGKTISDLNKNESENLIADLERARKNDTEHLTKVIKQAKELSGYIEPVRNNKTVFRGRYQRDGYVVEKYVLPGEGGYVIPLLLMIPDKGKQFSALIYINPEGKTADASVGGSIEKFVKKGFIVAVPDLIGTGETKKSGGNYGPLLISRNMAGIHAGDIMRVVNMIKNRNDVKKDAISAVAFEELCPALLHAAAFDTSINKTVLYGSPISYKEIVNSKLYNYSLSFDWGVAGALTAYDLPDLAACIAPRELLFIDVKDAMKKNASQQLIDAEFEFPQSIYLSRSMDENLRIIKGNNGNNIDFIIDWLLKQFRIQPN